MRMKGRKSGKDLKKLLQERRKEVLKNEDSILKRYEEYLALNDIYYPLDIVSFRKTIKGRMELCDEIMKIYKDARLENEKISLLQDLYAIGYDKNKLVEIILDVFENHKDCTYLWEYGDLLYTIKKHKYLLEYLRIIEDRSLGENRQMVVLLVGKSKKSEVIPILVGLLDDEDVCGHALEALTNFSGEEIDNIMIRYIDYDVAWIRNVAKKYLKKKVE